MTFVVPQWFLPILLSAAVLGVYDIAKKHAVSGNSVMPVLFLSTASGCIAVFGYTLCAGNISEVSALDGFQHLLIFCKSLLVSASWVCVYYAMRDLPISIASPVRASAPLWTFFGSLILYNEIPTAVQAAGMLLIFGGYYAFAVLGKLEGFSLRHKGMVLIFAGTLLGAASALYDKFLLNRLAIPFVPLQFYFSLYLTVILGTAFLIRKKCFSSKTAFIWKWSIIITGVLLAMADFLYFYALSMPEVKISLLSLIRRSGCIVSFTFGAWCFRDKRLKSKAFALALILAGVFLLLFKWS
jgi:drug/metabolite transporter (DMT)-like permease